MYDQVKDSEWIELDTSPLDAPPPTSSRAADAGGPTPKAGSTATGPNTIETVRTLEAGDTVKIVAGPWAGDLRIVSEAEAGSYEIDEQWFERSELEFQF